MVMVLSTFRTIDIRLLHPAKFNSGQEIPYGVSNDTLDASGNGT